MKRLHQISRLTYEYMAAHPFMFHMKIASTEHIQKVVEWAVENKKLSINVNIPYGTSTSVVVKELVGTGLVKKLRGGEYIRTDKPYTDFKPEPVGKMRNIIRLCKEYKVLSSKELEKIESFWKQRKTLSKCSESEMIDDAKSRQPFGVFNLPLTSYGEAGILEAIHAVDSALYPDNDYRIGDVVILPIDVNNCHATISCTSPYALSICPVQDSLGSFIINVPECTGNAVQKRLFHNEIFIVQGNEEYLKYLSLNFEVREILKLHWLEIVMAKDMDDMTKEQKDEENLKNKSNINLYA